MISVTEINRLKAPNSDCEWCGERHSSVCPRVTRIKFDEYGRILEIDLIPLTGEMLFTIHRDVQREPIITYPGR